jgi:hypothetical protein
MARPTYRCLRFLWHVLTFNHCCGSELVSMRIRIQLFRIQLCMSRRIRIQKFKPVRIQILAGHTLSLKSRKKRNFFMLKLCVADLSPGSGIPVFWIRAFCYGSGSADPYHWLRIGVRIGIRILLFWLVMGPGRDWLESSGTVFIFTI